MKTKNGWFLENKRDYQNKKNRKYDILYENGEIKQKLLHAKPKTQSAYHIIKNEEKEISKVSHYFLKHGNSARSRKKPSLTIRNASKKINFSGLKGLDFGCGHSIDAKFIESLGGECLRYDSTHVKLTETMKKEKTFDFIILSYVLNVVPLKERKIIAKCLWKLLKKPNGFIVCGVREDYYSKKDHWKPYLDGFITKRHTFQTFFHEKKNRGKEKLKAIFPHTITEKIGTGTYIIKWRD